MKVQMTKRRKKTRKKIGGVRWVQVDRPDDGWTEAHFRPYIGEELIVARREEERLWLIKLEPASYGFFLEFGRGGKDNHNIWRGGKAFVIPLMIRYFKYKDFSTAANDVGGKARKRSRRRSTRKKRKRRRSTQRKKRQRAARKKGRRRRA